MKTQKFVVVVVAIVVCAFGLTVRQDSAHVPNSGSDGSPGAQSVSARSGSSSAPERYVIEGADVYRAFATCFVAFRDSGDRGSGELSGMARIRDAAYDGTELTVAFGTEQTHETCRLRITSPTESHTLYEPVIEPIDSEPIRESLGTQVAGWNDYYLPERVAGNGPEPLDRQG